MEAWRWAAMMSDTSSDSSSSSGEPEVVSDDDNSETSHFEWSLRDHLTDVSGRTTPLIGGKYSPRVIYSTQLLLRYFNFNFSPALIPDNHWQVSDWCFINTQGPSVGPGRNRELGISNSCLQE